MAPYNGIMPKNPETALSDDGPVMPHPKTGQIILVSEWQKELARSEAPIQEVDPDVKEPPEE